MEYVIISLVKTFVLPPGFFLALTIAGLFLYKRKPLVGKSLLTVGLVLFYLLSTPRISGLLINQVETIEAIKPEELLEPAAQAIVILSGDWENNAIEYGGDSVGQQSLIRSRYGAFLHRKTGLPILVTGGVLSKHADKSLAQMMADLLKDEFQVGEVWLEDKSRTTGENALFSKRLLAERGIDTVYLVTQAWHMPRSVVQFEKAGLNVIPAPTRFEGGEEFTKPLSLTSILPSARALNISRRALYELAGSVWYRIRY